MGESADIPMAEVSSDPWAPFKETQYSLTSQGNRYVLFELTVRNLSQGKKTTPNQWSTYFQKKVPRAVESLIPKAGGDFSIFFLSKEARDAFHKKEDFVGGAKFAMEAFPPPDAPYWKPAPTIVSTRIRLLKVPALLPLSLIETALTQVKGYLKESATFETYANDRKVRNGNLTFYVDGLVVGTPWLHLRVDGFDLRMDNPSYPNHPDVTIPISSASAPAPAKAKEPQPPQAPPSTNPTAPQQLPQTLAQPPQASPSTNPSVTKPLSQPSTSSLASHSVSLPALLQEPNGSSSNPPPKRSLEDTEFTPVLGNSKKSKGKNKDKTKTQPTSAVEMSVDPKERSLTLPPPALTKALQFVAAHAAHWSNDQ